jgi:hypothetical protein
MHLALAAAIAAAVIQAASSSSPTPAFAPDGTLWITWVDGPNVWVSSSKDAGRTYTPAVRINSAPENIDAHGEARPKIAVGPGGEVYVSYTRKGEAPYTGDIRFSRRLTDGRFAPPVTVNDDGLAIGHRFDTLAVAPNGDVHVFWIDKRDLEAAIRKGDEYDGAALYRAVSTDSGKTFAPNRKVKDHVCECCRLAVAWEGATPVVVWRDILPGSVRDHSLLRADGKEPAFVRASDDGWELSGCPHHGPAVAASGENVLHLVWFTGEGKRGKGSFYRRLQGDRFSEPVRLGGENAAHPQVLAIGRSVWAVWKETRTSGATTVHALRSSDAGQSWSKPTLVARAAGKSDHPLLVAHGEKAFLSWFSADRGYRLIRLR